VADKLHGDIFSGPVSEEFCFLNENWPSDEPFCTTVSIPTTEAQINGRPAAYAAVLMPSSLGFESTPHCGRRTHVLGKANDKNNGATNARNVLGLLRLRRFVRIVRRRAKIYRKFGFEMTGPKPA